MEAHQSVRELIVALKMAPDATDVLGDLVTAQYLSKNYPAALNGLDLLSKREPLPAGSWFIRATCYDKLGELAQALDAYQKFLQSNKDQNNDMYFESTARVRAMRFGENAIEVEIYAYILERDYGAFLAAQEDLLLQVMETLERTGGAVALPTQTTMVTQDAWVDPAKAAAAAKAIEKSRDPGVPGLKHPELAPDGGANAANAKKS